MYVHTGTTCIKEVNCDATPQFFISTDRFSHITLSFIFLEDRSFYRSPRGCSKAAMITNFTFSTTCLLNMELT